MKRKHTMPWLVAAALALTLPLAAVAADEAPTAPETPEATATEPAPASSGLPGIKVGVDRRGKKMRQPTASEEYDLALQIQEFWANFPRHEAKTNKRTGLSSMVVAPHSITMSVVTIGPDGRPAWDCVDSPAQVEDKIQALREGKARSAAPKDR